VPREYAAGFRGQREVLNTHRAWDPGAAILAEQLRDDLQVVAHFGEFTRLLVDLNRRETSPAVFSEFTPETRKQDLLAYHRRWRAELQAYTLLDAEPSLHVSCHSFTPVWNGVERRVDVGILFDPSRRIEATLARSWQSKLAALLPGLRIRRNNPYRGVSDGTTSWLRKLHTPNQYAGIELELNQRFASLPAKEWAGIRAAIVKVVGNNLA